MRLSLGACFSSRNGKGRARYALPSTLPASTLPLGGRVAVASDGVEPDDKHQRDMRRAQALCALGLEDKDISAVESTDAGTSQASESHSPASETPEEEMTAVQSLQEQKRDLRRRRSLQHTFRPDVELRPVLGDLRELFKSVAPRADADFVAFQAILTDLPRFGLYAARQAQQQAKSPRPSRRLSAGEVATAGAAAGAAAGEVANTLHVEGIKEALCASQQQAPQLAKSPRQSPPAKTVHVEAVEEALRASCKSYPQYAEELGRLLIVHACDDFAIFADHKGCRLFTSVRGTDLRSVRDIGDDVLVFLGLPPTRVDNLRNAYTPIRRALPGYESFGCGHSLGGAVLHELVCWETDTSLALTRVDVFNPAGSPLKVQSSVLGHTRFLSHTVPGDLVSRFYVPPGRKDDADTSGKVVHDPEKVVHERDPRFGPHRLGHFLPK